MEGYTKYSNELLEGNVFIHVSVGYASKKEEFWNKNLEDKTYQIYAHSLTFLKYLTEQYVESNDVIYLDEAEELLDRWLESKHLSKFISHEQPVAARLNNILRFSQSRYGEDIPEHILKILENHINFLLDDNNYRKNNHGIMMDTSLSGTLKFIPKSLKHIEKVIINKVISRSQEAINRDFSRKGLHLENSPDYHRLTVRWLHVVEKNLNQVGSTLGEEYVEKLKNAATLDAIISMPNLRYPIYGDSSDGTFKGIKNYDDFIDRKAGRAIFHNKKEKSQLTFICGYGSKGHKHHDDLSFIFYDGNEVLFNDSGKYNYNKNDKIRQHLISPLAHNSLSVYKNNYTISREKADQEKVYIENFMVNDNYKLIKGVNNSYQNTNLIRYITILKNNTIVIIDKFNSKNQNTIAVNFNLGLNITATLLERGKYLIKGTENHILQSHVGKYTSVLLNDSELTPCKISNKFNKYESNQRILYRQKTRTGCFLTTISKENDIIEIIEFNENNIILNSNNEQYNIIFDL